MQYQFRNGALTHQKNIRETPGTFCNRSRGQSHVEKRIGMQTIGTIGIGVRGTLKHRFLQTIVS